MANKWLRWQSYSADQVREVGYPRQRLTDNELEGDGSKKQNERELQSTLRYRQVDRESGERQTADKQLRKQYANVNVNRGFI